ncbi:hypothetical protein Poli38472_012122 [Pythium oligandrum]|uniref:Uncharacterized protein n=1 Tax=Pythium oligandrum TaxID=41045 RepID=A0A8K1FLD3_PYTOL|nr:hypothetical protein Poli38472_012122 [Pythium oligandrum]|eukprot:TMW67006.1 hypothetical protein Poli38472_012122 [Pythium oligandrum]
MHFTTIVASAVLAALPTAFGHGNIVEPAAYWKQGYPSNGYNAEVSNNVFGPMDNSVYGYGPEGALKYYTANLPKSKYKTLRDLILGEQKVLTEYGATADCGLTSKDESKRVELGSEVKYSGFSHPGPCEIWCDNNKLAYADDCQKTYATGVVPIDNGMCKGADRLTIYWIGVQGEPWQVYTNCVYLKGSSGGGSSTTPSTAPSSSPSVTPSVKPSASPSTAPAPSSGDEYDDDATTAPTTKPSTAPTTAPTTKPTTAPTTKPTTAPTTKPTPSKNCSRRNRRSRA